MKPGLVHGDTLLLNDAFVDAVPCSLFRARSQSHARILARHDWLLRRKTDGCYLAGASDLGAMRWRALQRLSPKDTLAIHHFFAHATVDGGFVSSRGTRKLVESLGLCTADYAKRSRLPWQDEPATLCLAGHDRYDRPLWLTGPAARAWRRMCHAAGRESVPLEAISGFRSHAYQLGIFERKLARGQTVDQIISVNAAPGFSEHHSGEAIDIGTPGEPPAEESFEQTAAFAWLAKNAERFGFTMSYPRGNPHGISYEPWHWRYHPPEQIDRFVAIA